jgi:uncharacterized protein
MLNANTVLISGGTDGIGKAAVSQLLQDGCNVATFSRNKTKVDALKKELANNYDAGRFLVSVGDVAKESDLKKIVAATIKKFKKIDILVNNAGFGYFADCDKVDMKKFKEMIDVNLVGMVALINIVVPYMKKNKSGLIINISSTSGKKATPSQLYSATKFAVSGYSESIREELRKFNIRVTTVYPGMVMSNFFNVADDWKERVKKWQGKVPTMLEPSDIAQAIGFVCGQPARVLVDDITIMPFRTN